MLFTTGLRGWSSCALAAAGDRALIVLNSIVYAEPGARFPSVEERHAALPAAR